MHENYWPTSESQSESNLKEIYYMYKDIPARAVGVFYIRILPIYFMLIAPWKPGNTNIKMKDFSSQDLTRLQIIAFIHIFLNFDKIVTNF